MSMTAPVSVGMLTVLVDRRATLEETKALRAWFIQVAYDSGLSISARLTFPAYLIIDQASAMMFKRDVAVWIYNDLSPAEQRWIARQEFVLR